VIFGGLVVWDTRRKKKKEEEVEFGESTRVKDVGRRRGR